MLGYSRLIGPLRHEKYKNGPVRIDVGKICWWFKNLCLAPKDPESNRLKLQNRKEADPYQSWMIHEDPGGKFFRLENIGKK